MGECFGEEPYSLFCLFATGRDVVEMPAARRRVGVPTHAAVKIGRNHQPGFFEGLLAVDQQTFVSRTHFELTPMIGESVSFKLTNLSINPVVSGQRRLGKDEHDIVVPPATMEFVAPQTSGVSGGGEVMILRLLLSASSIVGPSALSSQVVPFVQTNTPHRSTLEASTHCGPTAVQASPPESAACDVVAPQPDQRFRTQESVGASSQPQAAHMEVVQSVTPVVQATRQPEETTTPVAQTTVAPDVVAMETAPSMAGTTLPSSSSRVGTTPALLSSQSSRVGAPFYLRLEGSAMQNEAEVQWLPCEACGSLTVGRNHQRRLHAEALKHGVDSYVSREHFCVEWIEPKDSNSLGCGRLTALGSNSIWIRRGNACGGGARSETGDATMLSRGQPPIDLYSGDAVLLFTGASDNTPDGPGCLGILRWVFYDALDAAAVTGPRPQMDDTMLVPPAPLGEFNTITAMSQPLESVRPGLHTAAFGGGDQWGDLRVGNGEAYALGSSAELSAVLSSFTTSEPGSVEPSFHSCKFQG